MTVPIATGFHSPGSPPTPGHPGFTMPACPTKPEEGLETSSYRVSSLSVLTATLLGRTYCLHFADEEQAKGSRVKMKGPRGPSPLQGPSCCPAVSPQWCGRKGKDGRAEATHSFHLTFSEHVLGDSCWARQRAHII